MTIWPPKTLNPDKPKYHALADAIEQAIANNTLSPGARLPPQRRLADQLDVTIGTVTRGYAEAERRGLLEAIVGSGTYVRQRTQAESFRIQPASDNTIDLGFTLALDDHQHHLVSQQLRTLAESPALLAELLSFVPETGLPRHREAARQWLLREGIDRPTSDILLCSGGQNGLFTALHTFCDSGDTVLSEGLTYSGFILAARHLRLRHIGLPMDSQGLTPRELTTACERYRPRALYLMPQLHNPTGQQMSVERKQALLDVCARYDVMVIEDNVQSSLLSDPTPPMVSLAPDQVISISSCSKCFAGGLRVGYLVPPRIWLDRFRMALRVNQWMVAPLLAELTSQWITDSDMPASLQRQRLKAAKRQALVRDGLSGHDYRAHDQSLSGWLVLHDQWRGRELVEVMAERGVALKSADVFAVGQFRAPEAVRLCIGAPTSEAELNTAVSRLRDVLEEPMGHQMALRDSTI